MNILVSSLSFVMHRDGGVATLIVLVERRLIPGHPVRPVDHAR